MHALLLSAYALQESTDLFSLTPSFYIVMAGSACLVVIASFILLYRPKKQRHPATISAAPKASITELRSQAYAELDATLKEYTAHTLTEEKTGERISSTCRRFVDAAASLHTHTMSLHELKQRQAPQWLQQIIETCYTTEFKQKKNEPELIVRTIEQAKQEIGRWQ